MCMLNTVIPLNITVLQNTGLKFLHSHHLSLPPFLPLTFRSHANSSSLKVMGDAWAMYVYMQTDVKYETYKFRSWSTCFHIYKKNLFIINYIFIYKRGSVVNNNKITHINKTYTCHWKTRTGTTTLIQTLLHLDILTIILAQLEQLL